MNEDTATEQNAEPGTAKPAVEAAGAKPSETVEAADPAKPASETKEEKPAKVSGVAYSGGAIRQGWNPDPVVVDLAGMTVPAKVPLLRNHNAWNTDDRLGNVVAKRTGRGIEIEGEIVSGTESAREIVRQGKLGADWQLSIGAEISAAERVLSGTRTVNGRSFQAPFVLATKTTLREVSVVAVGADRSTNLHVAAAFTPTPNLHIKMEEKDTKPVEAAAPTAPAAPAPAPEAKPAAADIEAAAAAAVKAERERVSAISAACGGEFPEIQAKAVAEGWTIEATNAALVSALRKRGPAPAPAVAVQAAAPTEKVLAAALAITAGIDEADLAKGGSEAEKAVEAAAKYAGIGLRDVVRECVRASGGTPGVTMDNETIRAAFSTVALPGILSDVANKKLLAAYKAQPIIAEKLCAKADLNDFKVADRYRLTDVGDLEQVAPDGKIKHGSLGEEKATNKLETYAKMFSLTRQMIYNDDLGAFLRVPAYMGGRAARKVDQLFFTRLQANPTQDDGNALFSAAHGNYIAGTTGALALASLKKGVELFRKQKDADGQPINVMPKFLLVPADLEIDAEEIVNGLQVVVAGATDVARPAFNALSRYGLQVVGSPYLASATGWYLFAEPATLPAFEIGYLRGKRAPTVERGNVDFDELGISWRVYFDVGVREQDTRGMVFAKGAN